MKSQGFYKGINDEAAKQRIDRLIIKLQEERLARKVQT